MGFPPSVIDEMTLWEFAVCYDGFRESKKTDEAPPPMADDELANLGIEGF